MRIIKCFAAAMSAAALMLPAVASADDVEVGVLTCKQSDSTNLVVFSKATYVCDFDPTEGENVAYTGKVQKIGVDLSVATVETLVWLVFAPSTGKPGALAGTYVGASADVALGVGAGVKVLVGGLDESITLQPASVSGSEGIGAAIGLEEFVLTANPG
ncbi:MAG: DUF992 domain-containing protein [Paracoccaceae bacterium]